MIDQSSLAVHWSTRLDKAKDFFHVEPTERPSSTTKAEMETGSGRSEEV